MPSLFDVLQASHAFISMSFFRLGKFSFMILLNIFSVTSSWSSSSVPIIPRFGLFVVSQISRIFCVKNLLDLTFS